MNNTQNAVAVISIPTAEAFAVVGQDEEGNDITKVEQICRDIFASTNRTTRIDKMGVNGDRTIFFCTDTGDDWLPHLTDGNIQVVAVWRADVDNKRMMLDTRFPVTLQQLKDNKVLVPALDDQAAETGDWQCVLPVSDGDVFRNGYELPKGAS